jgi:stearoyl-CoA desaturase (Delta-9 desaturase)
MTKEKIRDVGFYALLAFALVFSFWAIPIGIGERGLWGTWFETHTVLKMGVIWVLTAHLTITAMSLAFHRSHTHQAVKLNLVVDSLMQIFLWSTTSMSKLDWVSVHIYHHAHSDTDRDPHSPKQKGVLSVFFMGAVDYSRAKHWPEVLKIRSRIPTNALERFIADHLFLAPVVLGSALMFAFGPSYGLILMGLTFAISPLFAVGGVNALAHYAGYQNYDSKDESRNIGFLFPLNWVICGELDHNNHHKFPRSPSFRHRWFEFDIGWVYLSIFKWLRLAKITGKVPDYKSVRAKAEEHTVEGEVPETAVAYVG